MEIIRIRAAQQEELKIRAVQQEEQGTDKKEIQQLKEKFETDSKMLKEKLETDSKI
jgi:hypothetical protein